MGERWDLGIGEDLLIKESCSLAMKASSGDSSPPFLLHHNRCYDSVAIFAFPGSWTLEEWRGSPSKVDSNLFPSLRGLGSNESALVHGGFLHRFHTLLMNSAFEHQVKCLSACLFLMIWRVGLLDQPKCDPNYMWGWLPNPTHNEIRAPFCWKWNPLGSFSSAWSPKVQCHTRLDFHLCWRKKKLQIWCWPEPGKAQPKFYF